MGLDDSVLRMIGSERAHRLSESIASLRRVVSDEPEDASWMIHQHIALRATTTTAAERELSTRLQRADSEAAWQMVIGRLADGRRVGIASDVLDPRRASPSDPLPLLFLDLYTRVAAWRLAHLWRASEFAEVGEECLQSWRILAVAACARSLLEGVAAFITEGGELVDDWLAFKRRGTPSPDEAMAFRHSFGLLLAKTQFGSRIPELVARSEQLRRPNVMGHLRSFSKKTGINVLPEYDWLCDAVHPSFGFSTVFTAVQGVHRSGSTIAMEIGRRSDRRAVQIGARIEPTIANAAVDLMVVALDALLPALRTLRWLTYDIGLTSRAIHVVRDDALEAIPRPKRNEICPCGSGRKYKTCGHAWGSSIDPPPLAGS